MMVAGPVRAQGGLDLLDQIHQAKIGLSWFILDHVDRPLHIAEPCPSMPQTAIAQHVGAAGLVSSASPYGPAVVLDTEIGSGLAMLRCGNDLSRSVDPPGSVSIVVDVFMLDGQATFDQVAVALAGNDAVIETSADPAGETVGKCRNGGRRCDWALNVEGLVVVVRADNMPADTGEQLIRQLVSTITPDVIVNLAAYATETP